MKSLTFQEKKTTSEPANWITLLAMTGILLMSSGMGGFKLLQNGGMTLIILSSVLALPSVWQKMRHDPVFYMVLAFLIYLSARTIFAQFELPDWTDDHWDRARRMSRIMLLPLVAFWISRKPHWLKYIFAMFAIGVFLAIVLGIWEAGGIQFLFDEDRIRFKLNPQRMGYASVLVFIGLIIFRQNLIMWSKKYFSIYGAWALWGISVWLSFQVFLISQSRGAMLGFVALAVILVMVLIWKTIFDSHPSPKRKISVPAILILLLLITSAVFIQKDNFTKRFAAEGDVIQQLLSGDIDDLRITSISIRVQLWITGYNAWLEKPLFGWGTDGAQKVISQADLPQRIHELNHFHNTYIDILVRFGLIGFFILGSVIYMILYTLFIAYKNKKMSNQNFFLLGYGMLFFLLINITESHLIPSWGWFMLILIGGSIYSYKFAEPNKTSDAVKN
jgi:O-antigen ligase